MHTIRETHVFKELSLTPFLNALLKAKCPKLTWTFLRSRPNVFSNGEANRGDPWENGFLLDFTPQFPGTTAFFPPNTTPWHGRCQCKKTRLKNKQKKKFGFFFFFFVKKNLNHLPKSKTEWCVSSLPIFFFFFQLANLQSVRSRNHNSLKGCVNSHTVSLCQRKQNWNELAAFFWVPQNTSVRGDGTRCLMKCTMYISSQNATGSKNREMEKPVQDWEMQSPSPGHEPLCF